MYQYGTARNRIITMDMIRALSLRQFLDLCGALGRSPGDVLREAERKAA